MMSWPTTKIVLGLSLALLAVLAGIIPVARSQTAAPSEFFQSFLDRPKLLRNAAGAKGPRRAVSKSLMSVSLIVDNWSKYSLVYTAYAVPEGDLNEAYPPRNMPPKHRSFGMRTTSADKRVSGMAGWTVTDGEDGSKTNRVSVAWRAREGKPPEIALALGEVVPKFDDMWRPRSSSTLALKTSDDGSVLMLADSWTTVAVRLSKPSMKTPHYDVTLSVIPQNVDAWGWIKYYNEGVGRKEPIGSDAAGSGRAKKNGDRNSKRSRGREQDGSALQRNSDGSGGGGLREEKKPLYEKKELLGAGPAFQKLQQYQQTPRTAVRDRARKHEIAVGIHIENWTRFRLGLVRGRRGTDAGLESGVELESMPPPPFVDPGTQEVGIVANVKGSITGSSGVLRYTVGTETGGLVLSLMWSVPYNRQLWKTWVAVGLSNETVSFDQMYSNRDDSKFVRKRAGRGEFEFSDQGGQFILMASMDDASTTFKPVLHLGLMPVDEQDLAAGIRRQLGMSVVKTDDVKVIKEPFELVQASDAPDQKQRLSTVLLTALSCFVALR